MSSNQGDFPDYMDRSDDDDIVQDLLPSKEQTLAEFRSIKKRIKKTSLLPCCLRTQLGCKRLWTKERVVWFVVILIMTISACLSMSFLINYLNEEWKHGLRGGECIVSECKIKPDPRLTINSINQIPYACCCNTSFIPIGANETETVIETCRLPPLACNVNQGTTLMRYGCWLNVQDEIWSSMPNLWIIRTLTNLSIVAVGIIFMFVSFCCTRNAPRELLSPYFMSTSRMEKANHLYGLH